jgi:Mg2+ and Co2+ transporter CorA
MAVTEVLKLPDHFQIEAELREQLSSRPGHQRCVEGAGELLLVLHEVPQPKIPERDAMYFWKRQDEVWMQASGTGLSELGDLLDRYAKAIDSHEEVIDEADTAAEIFAILRHSGPLSRSSRNLVQAVEQVLATDADDREIRGYRDRAREVERAADLLNMDARVALDFWRALQAEKHARSGARLNRIAFRLNLLAGFFLPLVALGGLFGMNVDLPDFVKPLFWAILLGGLTVGGVLLWLVGRQTGRSSDFDEELDVEEDKPKRGSSQ